MAELRGEVVGGATVAVRSAAGEFLARAAYNPQSQIIARVWSWDENESIDDSFLRRKMARAVEHRHGVFSKHPVSSAHSLSSAYRLVNAESDGLPGLVVDRYADFLVCQFLTAGAEFWKREIVGALVDIGRDDPADRLYGIYERSDVDVREKEGLPLTIGVLHGDPPPDLIEIVEASQRGDPTCRFAVDVKHGHKTGFYLDQRDNRALVAEYAEGKDVLNCFAYTGGFGLWALKGGAVSVTNVEASGSALELAKRNAELNGFDGSQIENVEGDVFQILRRYRDSRRQFDVIILDPPKFASSRAQIDRAAAGYKDINLLAFKLLRPGGLLFTFSCSGAITAELFQKIVAGAALDAGREAQIVQRLSQAGDHPVALNFREGEYLKGLVCRISVKHNGPNSERELSDDDQP